MRHGDHNRKFGRETDVRRAFMRSLAEGLIVHGKIKTTLPRAKELRPFIEKLITVGKNGTVASQKLLVSRLGTQLRAKQLMEIAPRFKDRKGGYTRIVKVPANRGDAANMAIIEFVD